MSEQAVSNVSGSRRAQIVLLPDETLAERAAGRTVVVLDVLRATTTMIAALEAGVREIHIFDKTEAARAAADAATPRPILCGERNCLPPAGFDLGNSPGGFSRERHEGQTVYMSTTNGTRAILSAGSASAILIGALVNASTTAQALHERPGDVVLLCAGTDGRAALEDVIGAGAVLHALLQREALSDLSDLEEMAVRTFRTERERLAEVLAETRGGQNVRAAGLEADIAFAARVDVMQTVGVVDMMSPERPIVTALPPAP